MTQYKHDFSWGDTRGIREIMMKHAGQFLYTSVPWHSFGYPAHEGDGKLIQYTKLLIKDLTGKEYKHVLITAGATHALNCYIYAVRNEDTNTLYTHKKHFVFYPGIAANHGLIHSKNDLIVPLMNQIGIVDSPSNPEGKLSFGTRKDGVIWDAAYYTPAYCGTGTRENLKCIDIIPGHDAMAGSFNKLTGINGLRVGWLATDSDAIYQKALLYCENDVCGVSYPSQYAALTIIKYVDLNKFYVEAKDLIDSNKDELSRLNHIFSNQPIPPIGMFALLEVDSKIKELLERASVKTMPGSDCGDDRDSVRFNLANQNASTKQMVDAILKADKI